MPRDILTKKIRAQKRKLNKMLEQNSNIQREEIIKFSQDLDQLIKDFYNQTGFCSDE